MKSVDLGPRGEQVDGGSEGWGVPGGRNCKPLQYSCHENPMKSMKRQKDMTPEDEPQGN